MPKPDFFIKQNDRLPAFTRTLEDASGNAYNLTGATVSFRMEPIGGGTAITGTPTVTSAASGTVSYAWGATDTATAGLYTAEWAATIGGLTITFPNAGYDLVLITPIVS